VPAGNEHRLGYSDLQHKYAHIAAEALPRLLQHALTARRASIALNLEGDCSLLTSGTFTSDDDCQSVMQDSHVLSFENALLTQQCSLSQALSMVRLMRPGTQSSSKTCHCATSKSCNSKAILAALDDALPPLRSMFSKYSITRQYVDTSWQSTA